MTSVMLTRLYLAGLAAVAIVAASPVAAGSATGSNLHDPAVPALDCPERAELGRACLFNPAADITGGRVSRY